MNTPTPPDPDAPVTNADAPNATPILDTKGHQTCPICQREFASGYIKAHIRNLHNIRREPKGQKTECPRCHQQRCASKLGEHLRICQGPRILLADVPRKCPYCHALQHRKQYSHHINHRCPLRPLALDKAQRQHENSRAALLLLPSKEDATPSDPVPSADVDMEEIDHSAANGTKEQAEQRQQRPSDTEDVLDALIKHILEDSRVTMEKVNVWLAAEERDSPEGLPEGYIPDVSRYKGYLDCACLGTPITAAEYWAKLAEPGDAFLHKPYYVICSAEDTRKILDHSTPRIPILISASLNPDVPRLALPSFLTYLSTKDTVDVHRWDTTVDPTARFKLPAKLRGSVAVDAFYSGVMGILNFLNLRILKDNPIPGCIANIMAYKMISAISESDESGKQTTSYASDLSSCIFFHILATAHALSLIHVDHHYVLTTVFCEEGKKLWLTWPRCTDEEFADYAKTNADMPPGSPFPIVLNAGDTLIQPPRTCHAPYSVTNVFMTGTMHWDSRTLLQIVRQSWLERFKPNVTNEPIAKQFKHKILQACKLWKKRSPLFPWGSEAELQEAMITLKKWWPKGSEELE